MDFWGYWFSTVDPLYLLPYRCIFFIIIRHAINVNMVRFAIFPCTVLLKEGIFFWGKSIVRWTQMWYVYVVCYQQMLIICKRLVRPVGCWWMLAIIDFWNDWYHKKVDDDNVVLIISSCEDGNVGFFNNMKNAPICLHRSSSLNVSKCNIAVYAMK